MPQDQTPQDQTWHEAHSQHGAAAKTSAKDNYSEPPIWTATLWPHRSMKPHHFRIFFAIVAAIALIPLIAFAGAKAIWVVGAFVAADLALFYGLMRLTYRSGRLREVVQLWPDRLRVERVEPSGHSKIWEANPRWVRVSLLDTKRLSDYLVLSSSGREIELGSFLTPEERRSLADALRSAMAKA